MTEKQKPEKLTGDQRALLKLADAIYDDGFGEGFNEGTEYGRETATQLCARLLAERKERMAEAFNEDAARISIAAYVLAQACEWKGKDIARAFCAALTEVNFRGERKKITPEINKIFGTDISPAG